MKKVLKFLTGRLFITSLLIIIQLTILFVMVYYLSTYSIYVYGALVILSLFFVILIVGDDSNPTFKVAWIIPIMTIPFFGCLLFIIFGRRKVTNKTKERYFKIYVSTKDIIPQDKKIYNQLEAENENVIRQFNYIKKSSQGNLFINTSTEYFPTGEEFYEVYKEELKKAQKFIFMEYFIISEGKMLSEILDILAEKVKEGVDVRLMFDDLGTINVLDKKYQKYIRSLGIKISIFNPFKPSLDVFMNYRDHRKITVIDGNVGFSGGVNIADEYINSIKRFGYWKDCAIMIRGDAVSKLTVMFLQLWYYSTYEEKLEFKQYFSTEKYPTDGYVIPFGDGPMNGHLVGELSYIGIINNAKKYVYITTPYLVLDNEMITALKLADQSGVDVRIITPHIPDKWYVHMVTRSNYPALVYSGVRIFEYEPGFIHQKTIVADDEIAIVGTANFDFRSFYLHFENGIYMYKSKAVMQVKNDYKKMLGQCIEMTPEKCKTTLLKKFILSVMKLFSPFL